MRDSQITCYTRDEVEKILETIQNFVFNDNFILSQNRNRTENIDFMNEYHLTIAKVKDIISRIEVEDFCHGLQNENVGYEHEVLYVFCPQIKLPYGDGVSVVNIYTKFNIINGERVIVISFHRRNYPIDYLFK